MRNPEKRDVHEALITEQGGICCYCEGRVTPEDSHIEHFRPQSDPRTDPLDFSNMLCSCRRRIIKGEPRYCGNSKDDWFDEDLLVSPLEPSCELRFTYTGDGGIHPADPEDDAARMTIQKLCLDIGLLNDRRAKAIEPFLSEDITETEFFAFVESYLQKSVDGRFNEFHTTIQYLFNR